MAIRFTCPHCGRVMDVGDKFAGQTGPCTACGKAITIPGSPAAAAGPLLPARRSGLPIWAILLIVAGCSVPVLGICAGLLLPAVMSVREAARRTTSNNNLKQIGLALHNFHSTQEHFPARAYSRTEGKPLLSWRVLILPFIEQADLYSKFRLDEPWDSENNRKLIPLMPAIYQNPSAPASPGMASYLAVCGKGLAFDGDRDGGSRNSRTEQAIRSWSWKPIRIGPLSGRSPMIGNIMPRSPWPDWAMRIRTV